jgi:Rad52/22 family double-strand break repair protein
MPNNENSPIDEGLNVMNTSNDKKRGQIVPYADPRAYTDRLNALFSPQGWTRTYGVETMNNITRMNKGEAIITGKVLVTCTVMIAGIGSHSGTGEEWADDPNGMTAADAQAFKRACAVFGLGRYFYDFVAPWVDLDQNRQPRRTPPLPAWAIPENWRTGMRPPARNGNSKLSGSNNLGANGANGTGHAAESQPGPSNGTNGRTNGSSIPSPNNGHASAVTNGANGTAGNELDTRILQMEAAVGAVLYRNILREHGRVNQPKLICEVAVKQKVLRVLESAARGLNRLAAVTQRLDSTTVGALLAKLQAPPLDQIADMKTLEHVVLGLEELAGANSPHAA